jgi:hypothetical protein
MDWGIGGICSVMRGANKKLCSLMWDAIEVKGQHQQRHNTRAQRDEKVLPSVKRGGGRFIGGEPGKSPYHGHHCGLR